MLRWLQRWTRQAWSTFARRSSWSHGERDMWSAGQEKGRGGNLRGAWVHPEGIKECVLEKLHLSSKKWREDCRKEKEGRKKSRSMSLRGEWQEEVLERETEARSHRAWKSMPRSLSLSLHFPYLVFYAPSLPFRLILLGKILVSLGQRLWLIFLNFFSCRCPVNILSLAF